MNDWRSLALAKRWGAIDPYYLDAFELQELYDAVTERLPKIRKGDGLEWAEQFIDPWDAQNDQDYDAAVLRRMIFAAKNAEGLSSYGSGVFQNAVQDARNCLRQSGIEFEGFYDTFIYWRDDGSYRQIESKTARAIKDRSIKLMFEDLERCEVEANRYPWRRPERIFDAWICGELGTNTGVDHALQIFSLYDEFRERFSEERRMNFTRRQRPFRALELAEISYLIGRHHEAILKKPHEPFAVYGRRDKEAKSRAGRATAKNTAPETERIISEMNELVGYHTEKRASEIVHQRLRNSGVKVEPDAIRQRYRYHTRKLKIRSRPPAHS